ncbi:ubx domain-containing protein [Cystoisospora suis]|uniref:Ubx domain-containing protein n=1 Tax=Cystoisospora suis TaxID=483139 RepID=A0A2C6L3T9_9APIC|nr:ubx domain-containing protein [Cystoisospora suis]
MDSDSPPPNSSLPPPSSESPPENESQTNNSSPPSQPMPTKEGDVETTSQNQLGGTDTRAIDQVDVLISSLRFVSSCHPCVSPTTLPQLKHRRPPSSHPSSQVEEEPTSSSSRALPPHDENNNRGREVLIERSDREVSSRLQICRRLLSSLPSSLLHVAAKILHTIARCISRFLELLSSFLLLRSTPKESFHVFYERLYGAKHPKFFGGVSFQQAFDEARREDLVLAVYLHYPNACRNSSTSSHADTFCSQVLKNELIIDLLDETCIFYAVDALHLTGTLSRAFLPFLSSSSSSSSRLPSLLLLLPSALDSSSSSSSSSSSLLSGGGVYTPHHRYATGGVSHLFQEGRSRVFLRCLRGEDLANEELVISSLLDGQKRAEEKKEEKMKKLLENEQNRLLREEQEREFQEVMRQETLKRDEEARRLEREEKRKKIEKEKKETEKLRKKERRETAEKLRQQEKKEEEDVDLSSSSTSSSHDPASHGNPQKTCICLKLPDGRRVKKCFSSHKTSLQDLYTWADCLSEYTQNEEICIPLRFHLVAPPRNGAISRDTKTTLGESFLHPNSAVLLIPSESEEEED